MITPLSVIAGVLVVLGFVLAAGFSSIYAALKDIAQAIEQAGFDARRKKP